MLATTIISANWSTNSACQAGNWALEEAEKGEEEEMEDIS